VITQVYRLIYLFLPLFLALKLEGCHPFLSRQNSSRQPSEHSSSTVTKTLLSPPVSDQSNPLPPCKLHPEAKTDDLMAFPSPLPTSPTSLSWTRGEGKSLGIGYLGPVESSFSRGTPEYRKVGFMGDDWLRQFLLPLYSAPNGQFQGWIACGWIVTSNPSQKVLLKPELFYPGYSGFGFIVLEEQEGEWLRLRYSDSGDIGNGVAWVRVSHLHLGTVPLGFMRWQDRYQGMIKDHSRLTSDSTKDWGILFFSNNKTHYALRAKPSELAKLVSWIDADHSMLPLKIQGDWMYVRVYQPSNFCIGKWQGTVQEGWIRWIDLQHGNRLSEPYKGC
jgi:hypothetical protein